MLPKLKRARGASATREREGTAVRRERDELANALRRMTEEEAAIAVVGRRMSMFGSLFWGGGERVGGRWLCAI